MYKSHQIIVWHHRCHQLLIDVQHVSLLVCFDSCGLVNLATLYIKRDHRIKTTVERIFIFVRKLVFPRNHTLFITWGRLTVFFQNGVGIHYFTKVGVGIHLFLPKLWWIYNIFCQNSKELMSIFAWISRGGGHRFFVQKLVRPFGHPYLKNTHLSLKHMHLHIKKYALIIEKYFSFPNKGLGYSTIYEYDLRCMVTKKVDINLKPGSRVSISWLYLCNKSSYIRFVYIQSILCELIKMYWVKCKQSKSHTSLATLYSHFLLS